MLVYAIVALCSFSLMQATKESPRIIIVGCGASGIAAATRLLQNGFNNITILEAENRIGGRVYTTPFAGYVVDLGGQWVHGEEDNLSYELAWPLGLLDHFPKLAPAEVFDSSGFMIPEGDKLIELYFNISGSEMSDAFSNQSMGEYYQFKFNEFFDAHPGISPDQRKSLMDMLNLYHMGYMGGENWSDFSVHYKYLVCKGDLSINWKDRGYSTILDVMMKKYPDPTQELPVLNRTVLNTEVSQINYNISDGGILVKTANGDEYLADHIIITPSIGVLKADYKTLFNPPLPEAKINAIENLHLGTVVKIYLSYPEPWWTNDSLPISYSFYWREEDKSEYANNPEKSWMLGIGMIIGVEHKPRLLCVWVTGRHAREMEDISDDRVFEQIKELIRRFMGKTHNLTEPNEMLRSKWLSNKHFRGTWSYRSLKTERSGAQARDLAEPIFKDRNPLVMFAGAETHSRHASTVHGAIGSGYREADRLIKSYAYRKSSANTNESH